MSYLSVTKHSIDPQRHKIFFNVAYGSYFATVVKTRISVHHDVNGSGSRTKKRRNLHPQLYLLP